MKQNIEVERAVWTKICDVTFVLFTVLCAFVFCGFPKAIATSCKGYNQCLYIVTNQDTIFAVVWLPVLNKSCGCSENSQISLKNKIAPGAT